MRRSLALAGRSSRFVIIAGVLLLASLILPPLGDRPGGVLTFTELSSGVIYGLALLGAFRWLLKKISDRAAEAWACAVLLCAAFFFLFSAASRLG